MTRNAPHYGRAAANNTRCDVSAVANPQPNDLPDNEPLNRAYYIWAEARKKNCLYILSVFPVSHCSRAPHQFIEIQDTSAALLATREEIKFYSAFPVFPGAQPATSRSAPHISACAVRHLYSGIFRF